MIREGQYAALGDRPTRRHCLVGGTFAALAALSGAAEAQTSNPKVVKPLSLGVITRSGTSWARVVAASKGYFKDEGVAIDVIVVQGGPPAVVQQVIGGALDIGESNFDTIIRAIEIGAPISIFASSMIKTPFTLISAANVKSAADLKGKTVVVAGSPKDPTAIFLGKWLVSHGVAEKDVDVIYVGAAPDRLASLMNGAVAAAVLTQPFDFRAVDLGFNRLADFSTMAPNFGFLGFAARKRWLDHNGESVRGFLRALKRASIWMQDPNNKAEAIDILAADINQSRKIVTEMYGYYFNELKPFTLDLAVPAPYVDTVLKLMVETKDMAAPAPPASKYLDNRFLSR